MGDSLPTLLNNDLIELVEEEIDIMKPQEITIFQVIKPKKNLYNKT